MLGIMWTPVYLSFHWFVLIASPQRAQGEKIGGNVNLVSADFGKATTHDWSDTKHDIPPSYNPIKFRNFSFLILPSIYSLYARPSETIVTNKASIERKINRLSSDI